MALWIPANALGPTETNVTAADKDGATVTSNSVANTKGSWAPLITSTAEDSWGITVVVNEIHVTATATNYLLDIGIGGAGVEQVVLPDLDVGGAPTIATSVGAKAWFFPLFIPKGSRVSARGQAQIVSDVCQVAIWLHQSCSGWGMEVPGIWDRLGTITTSGGVLVAPGSGAFGSWTTILDPITKNYRWWHCGFDYANDNTQGAVGSALVEIGLGDTSAAVTTIGSWVFDLSTIEAMSGPRPSLPVFQPMVNDGAKGVFARVSSTAVENRGVLVYAAE